MIEDELRKRIVQLWIAHDDAGDRLSAARVESSRFKAIIDGERNPSTYEIAAIAEAFSVTEAWLLTGDDRGLDAEMEQALREETLTAHWHRRAEKAEAAIARVRQEHTLGPRSHACNGCGEYWPCSTIQALDGVAAPATQASGPGRGVLCSHSSWPVQDGTSECAKPSCRCHQEAAESRVVFCGEPCREGHTRGPACVFTAHPSEEQLRRWFGDKANPHGGVIEQAGPLWMSLDQAFRIAQQGVDTAGCDCGHDGMGASWHAGDCGWREARR